jgi:DNA-binding response OmpR family regulator
MGAKSARPALSQVMEGTRQSVLVVEDDSSTAQFLTENLHADGYRVTGAAARPAEALRAIELRQPDLVLLDLGLDAGSGLDVLDRVRNADAAVSQIDPEMPVIVLTGRVAEVDRVRGLSRGADDYVCKPFSYPELVARVRAVLRRSSGRRARGVLRVGELTVDPSTRSARLAGAPLVLSAKEFSLLYALAAEPTRVLSKAELLRDVWGYASIGATRTVDAHACRLRAKLAGGSRRYIFNVRGVGYRLLEDAP